MSLSERLVRWQKSAGRHDLPWQNTSDPYRIWLSEIMLQQTQVSTVITYYQQFLKTFPSVDALAAAHVDEVISRWAGLGYYARARNLHRCAQTIVKEHGGRFPTEPAALAELPGIGRSTAAAIAAFAFGKRAAILDGNVKRVFCRHFGIEGFPGQQAIERQLWALAESSLPDADIGAYTQGLMDLGATICTRSRPDCTACPLAATCIARATDRQHTLPTPRPRKAIPERHAMFLLITDGKSVLLERRPPQGIWGGLLVPPEGQPETLLSELGITLLNSRLLPPVRHTFTHFHLHIEPLLCHVGLSVEHPLAARYQWVEKDTAADAGVPAPMRQLLMQVASEPD